MLAGTAFAPGLLADQVAFVTGGGSGIGFAIASAYARLGARVVIASRRQATLDAAAARLAAEGAEVAAFQADVRSYEQVHEAVTRTVERFGALDILVNNAAGNFFCPTADLSANGWKTVVDIDLNGTFHCCRAAYAALKASRGGGRIISIVTMNALSGWPGAAHAAAAKAGILSLSRSLAVEWGPDGIRSNTISPGPIADTEGVRRLYEDRGVAELERRRTALGRFGRTEDVANAAVFLASPLAAYVTGENLVVDGGRWLKHVAA
ncbi:short-chain dehydrogenase [Pseudoroseomonas rhizosphaerae]|uniref:Short-chain dehydrogenase n=1 Tax=Teichococcus rhizosphaerae TaxID=1335062 RepID=A0A2C7A7N7_9PROT|nr:SDR family oxidoreductase [Pseudoroseomonas rhizosphaerae]PHK94380.1 short-chain dehydrogenase [Pseudoroseomonas rhizosphaerae]